MFEICKTITRNLSRIFSLITITHYIEVKVTANAKLGIITKLSNQTPSRETGNNSIRIGHDENNKSVQKTK